VLLRSVDAVLLPTCIVAPRAHMEEVVMVEPDRIAIEEVVRRIDAGEGIVLVDARKREAYEKSSEELGVAVRVPPDAIASHIGAIPNDATVVVFCSCPNEETSVRVGRDLRVRGFPDVRVLLGGFEAWKSARLPVVSKPIEPERYAAVPPKPMAAPHPGAQGMKTSGEGAPRDDGERRVAGEGVGAGHVPMTPAHRPPSEHRKRPDEAPDARVARKPRSDLDVHQRVSGPAHKR
jgi:3-mercaptopyruvate sulfurtransferase SseA